MASRGVRNEGETGAGKGVLPTLSGEENMTELREHESGLHDLVAMCAAPDTEHSKPALSD